MLAKTEEHYTNTMTKRPAAINNRRVSQQLKDARPGLVWAAPERAAAARAPWGAWRLQLQSWLARSIRRGGEVTVG
eukprot:scaffold8784_cov65-Phaeocystis_antarctica.AAC.2